MVASMVVPHSHETRRGELVTRVLAGAWRSAPPPLALDREELTEVAPLLLQGTAAALAWWRVRPSGLARTPPARSLRDAYRDRAFEASEHEQLLQEVLPALRAAGVEPILIKGWSIARLYPESGLRGYCDHDLCVRQDQVSIAGQVLAAGEGRYRTVELHQGIPDLKDRPWAESFRRSQLVRLGGVEVRVLCPEDHLRLLCLHQMRHGACAPLWICDLACALESRPPDFDWDYCLHGDRNRAAWILCFLGLACELLGAKFDEPALAARAADLPPWLIPTVLERWGRPAGDSGPLLTYWLDPIKSAFRRRLRPGHSLAMTRFLGLAGRVAEIPSRLQRQYWRIRQPENPAFQLHQERGE